MLERFQRGIHERNRRRRLNRRAAVARWRQHMRSSATERRERMLAAAPRAFEHPLHILDAYDLDARKPPMRAVVLVDDACANALHHVAVREGRAREIEVASEALGHRVV